MRSNSDSIVAIYLCRCIAYDCSLSRTQATRADCDVVERWAEGAWDGARKGKLRTRSCGGERVRLRRPLHVDLVIRLHSSVIAVGHCGSARRTNTDDFIARAPKWIPYR